MISTHVLDTSRGRPAAGVAVVLERQEGDGWSPVGEATTDADGRVGELAPAGAGEGVYRLTFDTGSYFEAGFYPRVAVEFRVDDGAEHHHVPLLLSPFGYSTYRGS
jgi:5-hydroxyisourate hydrolase